MTDVKESKYKACFTTDMDYDTDELNLSLLDEMCDKYSLKWRLMGDIMYILSWCGKWYFKPFGHPEGQRIALYHHNSGTYKTDDLRFYHKQKIALYTPYEIIEYIQRHDNYKYTKERVDYISSCNKIEKILKEINGGKRSEKNKNST